MVTKIIAVGELKEKYLKEAYAEYEKRISAFSRLETIELAPARLPDDPSHAKISAALESEGQKILSALPKDSFTVAMCVEGKRMTSEEFADSISNAAVCGKSALTFIIGSSYGLSERVKASCGLKLSLSDMTFPHRLFRVMLCEQIYRAFTIINHRKYHK